MTTVNNDLFSIHKLAHQNGIINATLDINQDSVILKGHFPDHPIVPGACMLQIIKEVLEEVLNLSLRLKKAGHLKFITMIDPITVSTVELNISCRYPEDGTISIIARLSNPDIVYFKFQGNFIKL